MPYVQRYNLSVATISFRPDRRVEAALDYLERSGMSRSEAIRQGLVDLADRRRRAALVAEVAKLANDAEDRAEKAAITALMDDLAPEDHGP